MNHAGDRVRFIPVAGGLYTSASSSRYKFNKFLKNLFMLSVVIADALFAVLVDFYGCLGSFIFCL